MYSVDVTATDVFSTDNPEKIFEENYLFPTGRRFDIHPNGDKLIMIQRPEVGPQEQKIFVILNLVKKLRGWCQPGNNMIGKTLSHYKILEKLGEGGIGFLLKLKTEYCQLVRSMYIEYNLTLAPDKGLGSFS